MTNEPLSADLAEERERAAARSDDAALVAYESKWAGKLRKLQKAHPERWAVPGLSQEEVRDLLTLRLIESLRADEPSLSLRPIPGKEFGLLFLERELRRLRKAFRLRTIPVDFRASPPPGRQHALNQEEVCLDLEARTLRASAQRRAESHLSRSQHRWLSALKRSAEAGTFFKASAEPNLSAASRLLGKNRSSAQRAFRQLQQRFAAALKQRSSGAGPPEGAC
jgi:hypothetical protein